MLSIDNPEVFNLLEKGIYTNFISDVTSTDIIPLLYIITIHVLFTNFGKIIILDHYLKFLFENFKYYH